MNYKINWAQNYNTWATFSEKLIEVQVDMSDLKEANELINRIKKNLK